MGRPKEDHDGLNQKEIDQIIALPIGGTLIIQEIFWHAIRSSMHKYLHEHCIDIKYKSFVIDENRRIIVKVKFKIK